MREHRLYTEQPLHLGEHIELEPRPAKHAAQVLRLGIGDALTLFNGDGHDYQAEIEESRRNLVRVRILSQEAPEPTPILTTTLAIGISRGERMDIALQKSVELGVNRIQPLFTVRTQVRLQGERLAKRIEHWRGVVMAACEQSGRRRLPELQPALRLDDWLAQAPSNGILLHHAAAEPITALRAPNDQLSLLIGPEGGLTPDERAAAERQGFTPVRLGPRVLRTETAPLAALAVIQALWGDFRS